MPGQHLPALGDAAGGDALGRILLEALLEGRALAAVERLYQVMDLEREPLGDGVESTVAEDPEGIELYGVCFRYGSGGYALEQTNLRIPAGKTVAIVGESGSGKSTLLKLLMRFYEPTDGRITIDRVDLREVALATLRSPRARSTARALARMVPPTHQPTALTLSARLMARATSIAAMAPSTR